VDVPEAVALIEFLAGQLGLVGALAAVPIAAVIKVIISARLRLRVRDDAADNADTTVREATAQVPSCCTIGVRQKSV